MSAWVSSSKPPTWSLHWSGPPSMPFAPCPLESMPPHQVADLQGPQTSAGRTCQSRQLASMQQIQPGLVPALPIATCDPKPASPTCLPTPFPWHLWFREVALFFSAASLSQDTDSFASATRFSHHPQAPQRHLYPCLSNLASPAVCCF